MPEGKDNQAEKAAAEQAAAEKAAADKAAADQAAAQQAADEKAAADAAAAEQAAAEEAARVQAAEDAAKASTSGQPVEGGEVHSSTKTAEETAAQAAGVGGTPVLDHGEPDPAVEAERSAIEKSVVDPWGTTPMQMRDQHDAAVDPAKVGVATRPDGSGLTPLSGIAPETVEDHPEGTLPPVG